VTGNNHLLFCRTFSEVISANQLAHRDSVIRRFSKLRRNDAIQR